MKRRGRAQQGLGKKRGGREGITLENYMTHILEIYCGGMFFAKELKEKVVIIFYEQEGKSTAGTEEEEGRERERGENQVYDTHPQNLLWW